MIKSITIPHHKSSPERRYTPPNSEEQQRAGHQMRNEPTLPTIIKGLPTRSLVWYVAVWMSEWLTREYILTDKKLKGPELQLVEVASNYKSTDCRYKSMKEYAEVDRRNGSHTLGTRLLIRKPCQQTIGQFISRPRAKTALMRHADRWEIK
ncbi:hypothetical protein SARC_04550 [Sphaeroforma arctica JP610]|uniref:Uncharacterized protein n=1 Tax=Sphaeroforma arctica JP610 TaxID=667725 RepID=A0A0L0G4M5_9EUKA|nr:hypothetical protein SARC_04550 [Sphaeroforma arctica JP610]KNC83183.1 hypothetical protein SARC_04550 [Sphaeroforma arctica JP610]|eukprot:XP_014157085.1 hypothetical protein SARC_04550 [Sphaeroforma arctica JP610]